MFCFTSALNPNDPEMSAHLGKHGDGVHSISFTVDDARGIYAKAIERGAKSYKEPEEITDEDGTVVLASICTYGDTIHTLV